MGILGGAFEDLGSFRDKSPKVSGVTEGETMGI